MSTSKEKCLNCVGGYLVKYGMYGKERVGECPACGGTGYYSKEESNNRQKAIDILRGQNISEIAKVFTCEHCGSDKVHYRKIGYRCPNHCEDKE